MIDRLIRLSIMVMVTFWPAIVHSAQDAYTIRDVPLKEAPLRTSPDVTILSKSTPVIIQQRQGGWYRVASATNQGWLKLLTVRFAPVMSSKASVNATVQYRSQTTLTTGIRGLSEGAPRATGKGGNFEQLKQFQSNVTDAQHFAGEVGLRSQEVGYVE